ncbi:MAG: SDR family oxidoreductase [Rhodospirillales bacterium]|jgi:NAD(P)-dependent dehydrogenase (short-subunit alcohol dehydrogenase family)|nr:SDR family oxidoreductase [Rhodospirillales bacterium]MDP6773135.1 SDR family oxidoreductase [Rhodospirillales bacterium]
MPENPGDLFRLDGRTVLVTGASGGLGRHFALVLAKAGASVAVAARRVELLADVAAEITAAGGTAAAVALDVTDGASIKAAFDDAERALGPIDVLINNAGVALTKPALETDEADWDHVLDTNLKGAWMVAREAARRMADTGGGTIINLGSIVAERVAGGLSAYAASKAGLIQLTRVLAVELARHSIRVNALAPGYIETDINRDYFATDAGQRTIKRIPQRRVGRLGDLDGPLLLLASEASAFMTGSVITVDGGHTVNAL